MRKLLLLPLALFPTLSASAQLPDSISSHLDSALLILKSKSLYYKKVDWEKVKAETYRRAGTARNRKETFAALAYAFGQLHDKYGYFAQYDNSSRLADSSLMKRHSDSLKAEWAKGWRISTKMLGKVAYFRMPNVNAFNKAQVDQYANRLYDSVAALAAQNPEGWIIDLRRNAGGNIRPMMASLAPFFDDGIVSYNLDRDNKVVGYSGFRNGGYVSDDTLIEASVKNKIRSLSKARIAVITGAGTGSSGEGVAAALKERKNTRLFGEPTAGYANSTEGFLFNNNNSYFLLTTSQICGKKKKPLPDTVFPHVRVTNNDHFNDLYTDNAVIPALQWLKGK